MRMIKWKECLLAVMVLFITICPNEIIYASTVKVEKERPVVIVLDPGHGGYDGGAFRRWGGKTYCEKNLNLSIAKACKRALEQYSGVKVYLTRPSDDFISLGKRVSIAKHKRAD